MPTEMTGLLLQARGGNHEASERVYEAVQQELRALAAQIMRKERSGHTLQPTALVNEACLRLFDQRGQWDGRQHFLALAATIMRRVLSDHARRRRANKRGGEWRRVTLDGQQAGEADGCADLLALDDALERLAGLHERQARIVEMRFLAGMTVVEVADELGVSRSTIEAEWRIARAWLHRELESRLD
jgi:RNA polymerase sigma factor (TIGR02999 family)